MPTPRNSRRATSSRPRSSACSRPRSRWRAPAPPISPVRIAAADAQFQHDRRGGFEVRPGGNAVNLEEEMLKVASNQMDFQAATALYTRGLGLLKTALGKRM